MNINIPKTPSELGKNAANLVAVKLKEAIREKGEARLLVSTGSSQFETLAALVVSDVNWACVSVFHLDEYIGLKLTHPASFRKYLYERFIDRIAVKAFYPVEGTGDVAENIRLLSAEILKKPIDVGVIGIGENAHIAFNDPPADFETHSPYLIVHLDDRCKLQQVNEGWFPSLKEVPATAISMSVNQIMKCKIIVSAVPHLVKAEAVAQTLGNDVTNLVPATRLKQHPDWHLFLDANSASKVVRL
ncbi:MAG: 6-phosphogluconolactonase [Bacteroidetes bacterium]|nr:6-phosphogluconolactonase [Bacteroidota bacterium]